MTSLIYDFFQFVLNMDKGGQIEAESKIYKIYFTFSNLNDHQQKIFSKKFSSPTSLKFHFLCIYKM